MYSPHAACTCGGILFFLDDFEGPVNIILALAICTLIHMIHVKHACHNEQTASLTIFFCLGWFSLLRSMGRSTTMNTQYTYVPQQADRVCHSEHPSCTIWLNSTQGASIYSHVHKRVCIRRCWCIWSQLVDKCAAIKTGIKTKPTHTDHTYHFVTWRELNKTSHVLFFRTDPLFDSFLELVKPLHKCRQIATSDIERHHLIK